MKRILWLLFLSSPFVVLADLFRWNELPWHLTLRLLVSDVAFICIARTFIAVLDAIEKQNMTPEPTGKTAENFKRV